MFQLLLPIIYLAFISLGLPDSLLGSAWPVLYHQLGVPVSYMGIISMIIAAGTVVSSLESDRLTHALGTGKVTAFSVLTTAVALFGFSISSRFWQLCLWAIPYGLGAGSVDASLNNYVALHYKSRHMSWLHCMWGIGCSAGPIIMGYVLSGGKTWHSGYRCICIIQVVLTAVLFISLPLWKKPQENYGAAGGRKLLTLKDIITIPGAKEVMVCFFCYCSLEQTAGPWTASYLTLSKGISPETAAGFASSFYLGITAGRALSGFITLKLNDEQMIKLGFSVIAIGIIAMLLPGSGMTALAGFVMIGLGCAPVYPSMIHSTPRCFGADRSQAIIGVQMASAYVGTCLMPALYGLIANNISASLLPFYLLVFLVVMVIMRARLLRKAGL